MFSILRTLVAAFLFVVATLAGAAAQTEPAQPVAPNAPTVTAPANGPNLDAFETRITSAEQDLARLIERTGEEGQTDQSLLNLRLEADEIGKRMLGAAQEVAPRLSQINARLDQLGPAPEGEGVESQLVADERLALLDEKARINRLIGSAETIAIRASDLAIEIGQSRRALFTETLTRRVQLGDVFTADLVNDVRAETSDLWTRYGNWTRFVLNFKFQDMMIALGVWLAITLGVVVFLGRWLANVTRRAEDAGTPNYFTRLFTALLDTLVPTVALSALIAVAVYLFYDFQIWREDIRAITIAGLQVLWAILFVYWLAKAVFSPRHPNLRLIDVNSRAARVIVGIGVFVAAVSGLDYALAQVSEILSSPVSLTVARSFIAVMLVGLAFLVLAFLRPFGVDDGRDLPWPRWVRIGLIALGLVPILTALFGYVSLARFATQQIVITGAIHLTMYIGYLSAAAMTSDNGLSASVMGERIKARFGWDEGALDRFSVAASLLTYLIVTLIGLPLIALQWGYQPDELRIAAQQLFTGFTVGSITISLSAILLGVLAFFIGLWLTRRFQNWLDGAVLKRGRMDRGVRTSIRTAVGYAGVALAGLIGVSVAGFDLSSLALVAGALSLGIGFGLQNIVSNFVSGLILLAERPFKEGDWIEAGGISGFVKKVSVRATEIETFHRQTIMLPNSELINSAVGNWTHRNMLARIDIGVGVGYGSDVVQVQEVLKEIALAHPKVMRNPEPFVLFKDFGASSLDFELRIYLADLFEQVQVQTDLRTQIFAKFKELGIEIPFPQRDVNFKFADGSDPVAEEAVAQALAKRRKRRPDPDG